MMNILILSFLFPVLNIFANSSDCLSKFLKTYKKINRYNAIVVKEENFKSLRVNNKHTFYVDHFKGKYIKMIFKDEGQTGYKNNGMVLLYKFNKKIEITKGKAKGVLSFLSKLASPFVPTETGLYTKLAVTNELFTVNRAGIDFIYKSLNILKNSSYLTISEDLKGCDIAYTPPVIVAKIKHQELLKARKVQFKTVASMEEKTGYPAFYMYYANKNKYLNFSHFLLKNKYSKIRVPNFFFKSIITISKKNYLPSSFLIYKEGILIAKYIFKDVKIEKSKN